MNRVSLVNRTAAALTAVFTITTAPSWVAAAPLAAPTPAPVLRGDISLFRGLSGGVGSVEIHDEDGLNSVIRPPSLQGIVLLDLDFVGRTKVGELDPQNPRYRTDVAGAARVELQGGQGSVYHYRRDDLGAGPDAFGYFLVDSDGTASVLLERDGTGSGSIDPFQPKLAVAFDASRLLVATTMAAGGDLLSLDLGSGLVTDHTSALGPQSFSINGLALGSGFGLGITSSDVLRFDTAALDQAAPVAFTGGTPSYLQGDVTLSADGSCGALIAGASPTAADVYCITSIGGPVRVSQTSRTLTGGGFLPESFGGPHLALSVDGSTCIWSSEEPLARETWTRAVVQATQTEDQVTADSRFADTLDTSGGILPFQANSFLLMVGETDTVTGGIENGDVYSVVLDVTTGTATVSNLSGTSGDSLTPFGGGGTISDGEGAWWLPSTKTMLVLSDENSGGGTLSLLGIDATAGTVQTLVSNVRDFCLTEATAGQLVLGMTRRVSSLDTTEVYQLPMDLSVSPNLIGFAGTDLLLDRVVTSQAGQVAFVASDFPGEYLVRVDVNQGSFETLAPFPLTYGSGLAFTSNGSIALSIGIPDVVMGFGLWPVIGAPALLPSAGLLPGQVLPH